MTREPQPETDPTAVDAVNDTPDFGSAAQVAPESGVPVAPRLARRLTDAGGGLRRRVARGTIVNAAFTVGLQSLAVLKGFLVAVFLTPAEYGVWTILLISLGTLLWLRQVGISDKYVQQDEEQQDVAFQKAFTLELAFTGSFAVLVGLTVPLVAWIYGEPALIGPGLLVVVMVPAWAFASPLWVYYRRMDFVKQRSLSAIEPVVAFVVTITLAAAGASYWSLVIGVTVGAWAGAAAAVAAAPYPIRLRYDRGTLRDYVGFSWPLLMQGAAGVFIAQVSILVGDAVAGVAAVGVIGLAVSIANYAHRANEIVTVTMYPAICRVKDRVDLLFESFVKSNRLALMWAVPFGVGLTLFASDLVSYGIGEQWRAAVPLLQAFGLIVAFDHLGFNWGAYFRARDDTRPIATVALVAVVSFLAAPLPLMVAFGLDGFALGMGVHALVAVGARTFFLTRMFSGFEMALHALRAIAPTVPAAAAILALRLFEGPGRGLGAVLAELLLYGAVTVVATAALERRLLREVLVYLRGVPDSQRGLAT